ncbi:MAG: two-component regulator propeller domain-containing protein [Bacteroidia bacterium]
MNKYRYIILLLVSLIPVIGSSSVSPDTLVLPSELFGTKEGLSQGFVLSIIQDREGYMWFTSKDGLNRWDGYHMTVFRNIPGDETSLQDNNVTSLVEDDRGRFWVGTATKGVFLFDKKSNRFYPFCNQNTKEASISKLQYRNNKLLVIAHENVILLDVSSIKAGDFNQKNLANYKQMLNANQYLKKYNYAITLNKYSNTIWLNDDRILFNMSEVIFVCTPYNQFTQWNFTQIQTTEWGIQKNKYYCTCLSSTGKELVVTSGNQVHLISTRTLRKFKTFTINTTPDLELRCAILTKNFIIVDNHTDMYLLNLADTTIQPSKFFRQGSVFPLNDALIDRNNVSWIGTADAIGVIRYDPFKSAFHNYPYEANHYTFINDTSLMAPHVYEPYLINARTGSRQGFPDANPFLLCSGISTATEDGKTIYAINYIFKKQHQVLVKHNTITLARLITDIDSSEVILSVFFDPYHRLWSVVTRPDNSRWMVEYDKTNLKEKRRFQFPGIRNNNPFTFVSAWLAAGQGKLWLGTLQGLFLFNPDAGTSNQVWKHWQAKKNDDFSLSENMIFSLSTDPLQPNERIWVGTNGGGLNCFNLSSGTFKWYSTADGLPNNVIYGILPDNQENIWLSTNNGLCRFNVTDHSVRNYTEEDGLPGNEFNRYQYCKVSESQFVFGGVKGMTIFNPAEINQKKEAANILITGLSLFNKPVDFRKEPNIIPVPVQYASTIHIPAGVSMFSLEFAVMDILAANQKTYKYKLEGFDKDWISSGSGNVATYTNIAPGTYRFLVTGTNSDGVACLTPSSIKIIILPEWWQTWMFKLIVVATMIGLIYVLYRYRLRQILKMQTMRNNIANDLHDEIGSTLSSISLFGESAKKLIPEDNPAQNILTKISTNTTSMLESMSDIVWAINTRNDQFDNLTNRMNAFVYELMEPLGIKVHFKISAGERMKSFQMEDRKNIYLLFKEIVTNAAKHSQCTNIWIEMGTENGIFTLKIKDDGIGFRISTDGSSHSKAMGGNGLNNINKRAKALNARLIVKSELNQGTEYRLTLKK